MKIDIYKAFNYIYYNNSWNNDKGESVSGSLYENHIFLIEQLESFIKEYKIKSIIDLCCGDFNWMKHVNLDNIDYLGVDVVNDLIKNNIEKYSKENIRFMVGDATNFVFENFDLVICKDCLYHLPLQYSLLIIDNIKKSKSKYFLSSTFYKHDNVNIPVGSFFHINLEREPFNLNKPIILYEDYYHKDNEDYYNNSGGLKDKSIGVWEINKM